MRLHLIASLLLLLAAPAAAQIEVPAFRLPMSNQLSAEALAVLGRMQAATAPADIAGDIAKQRAFYGRWNDDRLAEMRRHFATSERRETMGGVPVDVVEPKGGIPARNAKRVLINVHGGAFLWGAGSGALVEAIPIAATMGVKVVTVDYRLAPEHKYPAASEDVEAVYRALLQTHRPQDIGIYGCSAGGVITAQATAWIASKGLPRPGAIGTFCGTGAPYSGDSPFLAGPVTGGAPMAVPKLPDVLPTAYMAGVPATDPLAYPLASEAQVKAMPPTLLLAGGRDFAVSALTLAHRRLAAAGVESELQLFDGLPHAFFMWPDMPESQEAFRLIATFFDRHLGHKLMRTRTILTMALSYALLGILMNSVGMVILQSILHFNATKPMASTLEACKDLSVVATSFLLASYVPAFGYRRAQVALLAVMAIACLAASFASRFVAMQLLFVVTGLSFGVAKIATYSTIGLLARDQDDHASITGFIEGMFMVGVLSGAWIFSLFVAGENWLRVYWLLATLCAAAAIGWLLVRLEESGASKAEASPLAGWREMLSLAALPATVAILAGLFLYVLIEQGVGSWLPTFNNEILHLPPALSVQMSSIFVASIAAGRLLSGLALKRVSWLALLLFCLAGVAVLILISLPLATGARPMADAGWADAPLAAWLFPLIGLLLAPIYPTICSVALSALPKARQPAMTALIVIFSALGGTIGSFLVGTLFQRLPGASAFYALLLPLALIALLLPAIRRRQARKA